MLDAALFRFQLLRASTSSITFIYWGCSVPLLKLFGVLKHLLPPLPMPMASKGQKKD